VSVDGYLMLVRKDQPPPDLNISSKRGSDALRSQGNHLFATRRRWHPGRRHLVGRARHPSVATAAWPGAGHPTGFLRSLLFQTARGEPPRPVNRSLPKGQYRRGRRVFYRGGRR
jgi:hypothetical protein